jgi:uncharacterized membrane protein YbhN (UPF0104 family)
MSGRRKVFSVLVAGAVLGVLIAVVARRREEFLTALDSASLWVLVVATLLQLVALITRTEAWHVCVEAAGGTVERRPLYRAAGIGYLGSQLNAQVGTAARVAALRRAHPDNSPRVPALLAAEVPIIVVEGAFGALASFTLVGPLGLPWWVPLVALVVVGAASFGLGRLSRSAGDTWRAGLAALGHMRGRTLTVVLMVVAVVAQIMRNWLMLHAVGVDASILDATAVLIAIGVVAQLPVGPSTGAAAVVLILGSEGVGAAAAAGVLLTATGTAGALLYVAWAGLDSLWERRRAVVRVATNPMGAVSPSTPSLDRNGRFEHTGEPVERTPVSSA